MRENQLLKAEEHTNKEEGRQMEPYQNKIVTITGLRSHKLFGSDYSSDNYKKLVASMQAVINTLKPAEIRIGMATGSDLLFGLAAYTYRKETGNPMRIIAYIPGFNQTEYYSEFEKKLYDLILDECDQIIHTSKGFCTPETLKHRNREMVKDTEWVVGVWDGVKQRSGTYSTVNHAKKLDKTVVVVNPFDEMEPNFYHINPSEIEILQKSWV